MSKEVSKAKARKNGIIELLAGIGIAIVGVVATFISYNNAIHSGRAKASYDIWYGPMVLGAAYAIKGLIDIICPNAFKKNKKVEEDAEKATADADVIKEED